MREEIGKRITYFFHGIFSFRRSANDIGGYFVQKYFRTVTFFNHAIFQIIALFNRPMFEALEIPDDPKQSQKPNID